MKKSKIEKQLQQDLSASAPSDFGAVWDRCSASAAQTAVPAVELEAVTERGARTVSASRKIIPLAAVTVVLMLVFCLTLILISMKGFVLPSGSGYFIIDVNPSVQVDYGSDGVVVAARGLNKDGEELLDGLDLDGSNYLEAAESIFDACELHGYFSAELDDNAILMTASKENGEKDDKATAAINELFTRKFAEKKMKGVVISDVDNTKGEKDAEKYGISGQKYELIKYYLDLGGALDETEYGTITIRDLYSRITALDKTEKEK